MAVFNKNQATAFIKLFKMVDNSCVSINTENEASIIQCVKHGYVVFDTEKQAIVPISTGMYTLLNDTIGVDVEDFNNTFYKSHRQMRNTSDWELAVHQMMHYVSTYGMESLGFPACPFIPSTEINAIPLDREYKYTIVYAVPQQMMIDKFNQYLSNLTAPSEMVTLYAKDLMPLFTGTEDDIKSFEMRCFYYDQCGILPRDPINALRYAVFKATSSTLLIKNKASIVAIKNHPSDMTYKIFNAASVRMAEIFFRYKPLFLAFKTHPKCRTLINQIRKWADNYHKPLSQVCIQNYFHLNEAERASLRQKASNRELFKLLNACKFRLDAENGIPDIFLIRNGRIFTKSEDTISEKKVTKLQYKIFNELIVTLQARFANLKDKKFYIPSYIDYAIPISEKQLLGGVIPYGTRINFNVDKPVTTGIHWYDHYERTDVDLHMHSPTCHFGWCGNYRDENIAFSGDMVDAPLPSGASEAFWIKDITADTYILSMNLYSGCPTPKDPLVVKFFIADDDSVNFDCSSYAVDMNKVFFPPIPMYLYNFADCGNIGFFHEGKFYFYGGSLNTGRVPQHRYPDYIKGITGKIVTQVYLREFLEFIGATVYDHETEDKDVITLTPEALDATTLMNIVDNVDKS